MDMQLDIFFNPALSCNSVLYELILMIENKFLTMEKTNISLIVKESFFRKNPVTGKLYQNRKNDKIGLEELKSYIFSPNNPVSRITIVNKSIEAYFSGRTRVYIQNINFKDGVDFFYYFIDNFKYLDIVDCVNLWNTNDLSLDSMKLPWGERLLYSRGNFFPGYLLCVKKDIFLEVKVKIDTFLKPILTTDHFYIYSFSDNEEDVTTCEDVDLYFFKYKRYKKSKNYFIKTEFVKAIIESNFRSNMYDWSRKNGLLHGIEENGPGGVLISSFFLDMEGYSVEEKGAFFVYTIWTKSGKELKNELKKVSLE